MSIQLSMNYMAMATWRSVFAARESMWEITEWERRGSTITTSQVSTALFVSLEVTQVMHDGSLCQQVMCVMTQSARENWKTRSSTLDKTYLKVCYIYYPHSHSQPSFQLISHRGRINSSSISPWLPTVCDIDVHFWLHLLQMF